MPTPLPHILNPPTPPHIEYAQYIIIYHVMGVFDIRVCVGSGGFNITGRGLGKMEFREQIGYRCLGPKCYAIWAFGQGV